MRLVLSRYKLTPIIALYTLSPDGYDCSLSHYIHIRKYNSNYVVAGGNFLTFARPVIIKNLNRIIWERRRTDSDPCLDCSSDSWCLSRTTVAGSYETAEHN